MKRLHTLLCVAAVTAVIAIPVHAQGSTSSSLQGKVVDPSGGAIVGARITVMPEGSAAGPATVSDQNGQFAVALEPGKYLVKISARDFLEASEPIFLGNTAETREFMLQLPGIDETVVVTGVPDYQVGAISSATKTLTPLHDVPQSITVVTQEFIKDQGMTSVGDVVRYVPGVEVHQGENNRDQLIIRGNSTSADFFLNGVRDDAQYYRDLYNLERLEALKGPNAMIFGRGGGGGVVNRVTKEAGFQPIRDFSVQGGHFANKRATADFDQPLGMRTAFRLNGVYENSDSFRRNVGLERTGVNPTLTFAPNERTKVTAGYEYLKDTRVADRGITSFQGRAVPVDPATYYGNADDSPVRVKVHLGLASFERRFARLTLHNRMMVGDYDRFYQNYVPGATAVDRNTVSLTAYSNATHRKNVFNQTDLVASVSTGGIKHTLLAGTEFGRQVTDNFRTTGFFNNTAATISVPYLNPATTTPVTYRQSATDADNHVRTKVSSAFAQDQIELSRYVQVIGGVRFDRFDLLYHNNRNTDTLGRIDNLVSPRAGLVVKPVAQVSLYSSYSVSYLPSSGDQFSSLTTITQQVKPEKFNNYELGMKWDPASELSVALSGYRLNRTNTRSTDPNDPTRIVQTGSQRTNGFELAVTGIVTPRWRMIGGYSYQDAFVTSATTAARAGALVGQVPHHTASLWNNYKIHPRISAGLGLVSRSAMFATIDNTVTLPGYLRADGALYLTLSENVRLQGNLENIANVRYFTNADSNTNISPGSPRAIRVAVTTRF